MRCCKKVAYGGFKFSQVNTLKNGKSIRQNIQAFCLLILFILVSFSIKLYLIFTEGNNLTLFSDDLNYVKSAVAMVKKGIFVFWEYNEPTVFITPVYPFFLAAIFKIFGYGFTGFQIARIAQAVLSSITIVLVFYTAELLFNRKTALISSFLVSFYFPNIVTTGYFLTETLFTTLLILLLYLSIRYSSTLKISQFIVLGIVWVIATLCRPTIALYPLIFFPYLFIYRKINITKAIKLGISMAITFVIIISPWWIRNYREYGMFIPLAASSGNPMLQGTYINYEQTPENIVYYKLGKNALETNQNEVETAKKRMIEGFKNDFWRYLKWYTIDKTLLFWRTGFYWREFLGVNQYQVILFHYIILLGFIGMFIALLSEFTKYILPIGLIAYFNVVHCYYMAIDRYAFPLLPILSIFTGYFIYKTYISFAYFTNLIKTRQSK
ncbi:MAG TPA: glycosyltransferase family 39 protein [Clostridiaceae bacterium]|nr:glycosyltransferase family 39 protein [Clostridiaceae bacterium]